MPSPKSDERQTPSAGQRIAKLLARAGIASRREIERMIADGRVAIDGVAIDTPATLLASLQGVTVDGAPVVAPAPARLFVFHKPAGVLTAERDFSGRPTIYDRLPNDLPRLVPVGRLDLGTEGLLLMTNDGGLKRRLELPATGVERAYRARAYGQITQARLETLIEGVEIDGVRYGPIDANLERRPGANVWIEMILTEGKNREVRRVLDHLGLSVSRLIRTRYGPFVLGDLPAGAIGEVRQADLTAFLQSLKLPRAEATADASATPIAVSGVAKSQRAFSSPLPGREGPGVGARGAAARSSDRPAPNASLVQGGQRRPRPSRAPKAPIRNPSPVPHREEREELDTRPPRRERAETTPTPRPPKPVRKAGWAKAKPKSRPGHPQMRIIAGRWRGRPIVTPAGVATRPTADRVREALFSMLASRLDAFDGLAVADLFAGSGALGLEALSRGAATCLFVEQDKAALDALRTNIAKLGAAGADIRPTSVFALGPAPAPLDLILIDPPYGTGAGAVALDKLARLGWIDPATWISLETGAKEPLGITGFAVNADRVYGKARITLLRCA